MNTQEMNDVFNLLVQTSWTGSLTPRVIWSREANNAVAMFGGLDDATRFVYGYLKWWDVISKEDTEETARLRGIMEESQLPKRSLVYRIEIPRPVEMDAPISVRIPLEIISPDSLKALIRTEKRFEDRPSDRESV